MLQCTGSQKVGHDLVVDDSNTEISQNNFCLLTVKLWTCIFTLFIIISLEINFVVFYKDIVP